MKTRTRLTILAAASIVVTGTATVRGEMRITPPSVMDDALLSITISDFHGAIDGLGTTAAQVSPMMNATTIKSLLGMQLGDPMLSGIAAGKGLAVVALDPQTAFAVIELSAAQVPAYTNKLGTMGMQCQYSQGVLVVAKTLPALAKGTRAAASVRRALLAKRSPTIRIGTQPAAYIAANAEQVQAMLKQMTASMEKGMKVQAQMQGQTAPAPQSTVKILEGEVRVLLSLLKQVEAMEIVIAPTDGALQANQVMKPVAGSRVAALINAPKQNKWNPKVQSGAAGSAAFMIDFLVENTDALAAFISDETEQLASEMALEADSVEKISAYMQKCMGICGGTVSESILGGTSPGLNLDYVMEISSEKAALGLLKNMEADLKATGFMDFYDSMGMPISFTFKEKVRRHKGVDIHQFRTTFSLDQMPAMQRQQMEAMNFTDMMYEVAILDGIMAYAMGDTKVESIIDRIKSGSTGSSTLAARKVFPAGGFYYGDTDIGRYMAFVSKMMPKMPNNPMPFDSIGIALQGAPPITSAGHAGGGLVQWSTSIPGGLLAKIGQAAMAIQMQKMQQQMKAPAQQ
ncbi:MAG: hypothetical protein QGH42_05165 [Kiritimatiellia bacterium]|jgi:hypothetical protein|nr:hypothetical protein [Kiritimatiellia bacterium]MDP6810162.1 hypothetical protein [Kiritimatiellia bacterium]MDP7023620.1 hypothetical protein [Kiritimatiellia bacterium]